MVTVAPGQNSAAPRSERGAVLPTPTTTPEANRPVLISKTEAPSPGLSVADAQGNTNQAPGPGGPTNASQADGRLTQIVGEARDLQGAPEATLATAEVVSLPESAGPRESQEVALTDGVTLPEPAFLTNAERAQAITAYETAQTLTESGRLLLQLSGDASPPALEAA